MSKATGFKSTVSVKLDTNTGKLAGWESLFAIIGQQAEVGADE